MAAVAAVTTSAMASQSTRGGQTDRTNRKNYNQGCHESFHHLLLKKSGEGIELANTVRREILLVDTCEGILRHHLIRPSGRLLQHREKISRNPDDSQLFSRNEWANKKRRQGKLPAAFSFGTTARRWSPAT